jgi:tetratricopeptide (TPR) repeat protein
MSTEQWDEAIERYLIQIQGKDESFFPYTNIAEAYRAKGMYEAARKVLEGYLQNIHESDQIREELSMNYFFQGEYEPALAEIEKAIHLNPDNIWLRITRGNIYVCQQDFDKAKEDYFSVFEEEELGYHLYARIVSGSSHLLRGMFESGREHYRKGLELADKFGDNWWRVCFHIWRAYSYLQSGQPEEALKDCEAAWSIAPDSTDALKWQRRALYYRGRAFLALNSVAEAQKAADGIEELVEKGTNKKDIRYAHHLLGLIELKKKNYAKAIDYFTEALSLLPYPNSIMPFTNDHADFTEGLASAFYELGDTERAREEFEKTLTFAIEKLYFGDIYARSLYWLGRICEETGKKSEAIGYYEKFLDLWKDADPGKIEVKDAGKRLAALR